MRKTITHLSTTPAGPGWYAYYATPERPSEPRYLPVAFWRTTVSPEDQEEAYRAEEAVEAAPYFGELDTKTTGMVVGSNGIEEAERSWDYGDDGFAYYGFCQICAVRPENCKRHDEP